jgi:hypothetical protein
MRWPPSQDEIDRVMKQMQGEVLMRRTGSVAVVLGLLFLATAAGAQSRRTSLTASSSSSRGNYSLLGGETVPTGVDVASGEFGYPGISFGLTHGTSPTSDIGIKFDILYGFEYTTISEFGLGVRIPFRFAAYKRDRLSVLFHLDPGIKFYTTDPASFGFQWPIGLTLGYTVGPELNVAFGVEVPMTLFVTPSPVDFVLGPMFGPAFEYHVDRELTLGLNTRFGPIIETAGGNARFGFITQFLIGYRL